MDGITVFYRSGRLAESSALQASPVAPCLHGSSSFPMCGWGFETVHQLTENTGSPWGAELAVGYDFLNLRATLHSNKAYEILGSVQTLPSITLYVSRDLRTRTAVYVGLGTGLLVLKNVRAYDSSGRVYSIDGNTWALTPSIGATYRFREAKKSRPGASFFIEASYEIRDFPSVAYSLPPDIKTLPSDLPRSLSASGPVLNVGFEINLYRAPAK